jgi:hypothetical protein
VKDDARALSFGQRLRPIGAARINDDDFIDEALHRPDRALDTIRLILGDDEAR